MIIDFEWTLDQNNQNLMKTLKLFVDSAMAMASHTVLKVINIGIISIIEYVMRVTEHLVSLNLFPVILIGISY